MNIECIVYKCICVGLEPGSFLRSNAVGNLRGIIKMTDWLLAERALVEWHAQSEVFYDKSYSNLPRGGP